MVCGAIVRPEQHYVVKNDGNGHMGVAHKECLKSAANAQLAPSGTFVAA
jgi:hypothetical protein